MAFKNMQGEWLPHPPLQAAIDLNLRRFYADQQCTVDGCHSRVRYVHTRECVSCAAVKRLLLVNVCEYGGFERWIRINDSTGILEHNAYAGSWRAVPDGWMDELVSNWELYNDDPARFSVGRECPKGHTGLYSFRKCHDCQRERDQSPRKRAIKAGDDWYTPNKPCRRCGTTASRHVNGRCSNCDPVTEQESPRQQALRSGDDWYTPNKPCRRCGTTALRRVSDGYCSGCDVDIKVLSPRQRALRSGDTWYTPDKPCRNCGTHALRHVNNGRCQGCSGASEPSVSETRLQIEMLGPDCVIDRATARDAGLKVFRTGRACKRGHVGFRWVSTGNCLDCSGTRSQ